MYCKDTPTLKSVSVVKLVGNLRIKCVRAWRNPFDLVLMYLLVHMSL